MLGQTLLQLPLRHHALGFGVGLMSYFVSLEDFNGKTGVSGLKTQNLGVEEISEGRTCAENQQLGSYETNSEVLSWRKPCKTKATA